MMLCDREEHKGFEISPDDLGQVAVRERGKDEGEERECKWLSLAEVDCKRGKRKLQEITLKRQAGGGVGEIKSHVKNSAPWYH